MTTPLMAASVEPELIKLRASLPQSLLLSGKKGIGLLTIARWLARDARVTLIQPQANSPASSRLSISVETVRELYEATRSKSSTPYVVIIDDIDTMTIAAQNAFLKLLEEPVASVRFIVTSHAPSRLLPTIRSRLQQRYMPAVENDRCVHLLDGTSQPTMRKIMFLASGLPAEMNRLAGDEAYLNKLERIMLVAKQLIQGERYDRLHAVAKLPPADRGYALEIIERTTQLLLHKPSPSSVRLLTSLLEAEAAIERGGNVRLQLLRSVIQ